MKRIFAFSIISLIVASTFAQEWTMKQILDYLPTCTVYPFINAKQWPEAQKQFIKTPIGFKDYWGELPIYSWEDIQCTQKTEFPQEDAALYLKFIPFNEKYILVVADIGVSDPRKQLLITYTNEGKIIDWIECEVAWATDEIYTIKQWKVDKNPNELYVTIYHIKPTSSAKHIDINELITNRPSFNGQRIDTEYKINDTGHFIKVSQIEYVSKDYSYDDLNSTTLNIWDGKEVQINNDK
ncbi:hypothetical protein [Bacteroides sp. GM023]|uniref:hypothetical protein n=1 Tax=Bacteroides sp. GM023 TaxID=2723058 RepID=UPI00168B34A3|nr:hypothetical protein [Bacteroides sp. GM023]MBD3587850.1 hypothetical protein [Bacteroides sp. GM023]